MSLEELKKICQERVGMPPGDFDKKVTEYTTMFKQQFPKWTPEQVAQRIEVAMRGEFKSALRSRAITFTGVFLGASDPFDMVRKRILTAKEIYLKDPAKAVQLNLTDAAGTPIDERETFATGTPNRNFRKPLPEHSWIKNVLGVFTSPDGETKAGVAAWTDNLAEAGLPLYKPLTFRANIGNNSTDKTWVLNQSKFTEFLPTNITMPSPGELLNSKYVEHMKISLAGIEGWLAEHDNRTPMIVDADVEAVGEPNETTGNLLVMLNDSARDIEAPSIGCFVGPRNQPYLDFGTASRVSVIGTCRTTTFMDEESVNITCWGMYAYPELKTNRQPVVVKNTTDLPIMKAQ